MIQQAIVRLLLPVILAILSCNNPSPGDQHTHPDTLAVAERADIIPAGLPAPDELSVFVPEHYSILDTAAGDLNLDKKDDLILVLKRNGEDTLVNTGEPDRPLLILIRDNHNRLQQVRRNDNTVYCIGCGGIMGDPYVGIVIRNGYFSVEHYGGSAWRWTRIITYKYVAADQEWYLHKDGSESFHASEPDKIKTTIRTTRDFGNIKFEDFDIYEDR